MAVHLPGMVGVIAGVFGTIGGAIGTWGAAKGYRAFLDSKRKGGDSR